MTSKKILPGGITAGIFLLGIALHVAGTRQPFLGNFAQHQTDYATVVQRWLAFGIHPFQPVMRFMAEGGNRVFLGDLPLTMTLAAWAAAIGGFSVEVAGRGFSALCFFLSLVPFRRIALRLFKEKKTADLALFFYLFSPLTLVYGQAFLLEMPALCLGLWGFFCLFEGLDRRRKRWIALAGLLFSLMLSLRIYYGFVLLPVAGIFFHREGGKALRTLRFWLLMLIAISIPLAWQAYAAAASRAAGQETSLQDNFRVFVREDPVLEKSAGDVKYYLPVFDTAFTKLATPAGFVLAFLFFMMKQDRRTGLLRFTWLYLASFGLLLILAPRKFVEFEYYFLPLVPPTALWAGAGLAGLSPPPKSAQWVKSGIALLTILLALRYAAAPMWIIPAEDRHVLAAAARVRDAVPADAKVIASHGSSTSFLYYTDRDGWAFDVRDDISAVRNFKDLRNTAAERLELFRSQGADYFALADKRFEGRNPSFFEYLRDRYKPLVDDERMLLFKLRSDK